MLLEECANVSSFFQLNVSRSVYPSWNDTGQTENVTVVCCNQATTGVAPGLSATATFTIRLHDMWLHSSSAATERPQGGEPPSLDPSSCWIKTVAAVSTLSYYPALCIFFNNTAVLGLYYDQVSFISSAQDFYSKADSSTSNLRVEPSTIDQGSRGYSQVSGSALTLGSPIRLCLVQYDMLSGDLGTDPSCQLAAQPLQLPAASFSSRLNTVKYLEDFNTDGGLSPILMTSEVCSNAGNTSTTSASDSSTGFPQQSCAYNVTSGQALCSLDTLSNWKLIQPSLCSWDNGEVIPPVPTLTGNLCENVVLSISYRFTLTDSSLSQLVVDMHLGAVDVTSSNMLFQKFRASFVPSSQTGTNLSNILNYRSGVNAISDGFSVQIKASRGMPSTIGVPIPGVDNLCSPTSTRPIIFGQDVHSSCLLKLDISDFRDCQQLRSLILAGMATFHDFTAIARIGNPSFTNPDDWISLQVYDLVNWRISCPSGDLESVCIARPNATNSFMMATTITFTEVPQDWSKRLRFARDPADPPPCRRQACWSDAFEPWHQVDPEGGELASLIRARRIGISIALALVGFLSLFIFRPLK
ncbi:unnamed protein product [Schistocephalus solidus]|uniref:DUF1619 domain-containing protein n=1 Tax=Schistocephalus solidus TaxID=70667 RepID=A0A183SP72_SCHSO|nr:unnamed protein product [Schistocephalus solidus]